MSSSTQFYRNLVGLGNIGVGATNVPTSNIQVTGNVYASNALVSPLILGTSLVGTHYGVIAGSNTITGSTISGTTLYGTLAGSNTITGSTISGTTLYGTLAGSNTGAFSSISLGTALSIANGGTGQTTASTAFNALSPMTTLGDIIYGGASGTGTRLAGSTTSSIVFLSQTGTGSVSAAPVWTASTGTGSVVMSASPTLSGTITGGTFSGTHSGSGASLTNLPLNQFTGLTAGGVAYGSATTTIATNSAGTSGQALLSGGAGAPTWGTLGLAYGGTGATSAQAAMNALAGAVTSAQYLRGNGTNVVMSAIQVSDVPTLNQNTTGSSGSCTGNSATATTAVNVSGGSVSCTSVTSSGTIQTSYAQGGNAPNTGQAYFYNPTNSAGQNASCGVRLAGATAGSAYYSYDVNGVAGFSHGITGASQNLVFRAAWDFSSGTLYTMDRSGNFTATGDIIAYSDRRIKTDIKQIEGALDKVSQIGGYTFTRTDDVSKGQRQAGVIAQELLEVLPEVVRVNEETGYYTVSYGNITALLIEALKEERKAREALEERISQLELKERASI